jgi:succinate dehydrogenase/fumarate reductase cytochrome b subunit
MNHRSPYFVLGSWPSLVCTCSRGSSPPLTVDINQIALGQPGDILKREGTYNWRRRESTMKDLMKSIGAGSPVPAWLDVTQSVSGLVLAVFMWIHLFLVSSILLGRDAMYYVTGFFELRFLTGWQHGYPILVSIIAVGVFFIFIIHAGIALRKFPISWRQHRILRHQMSMMKHSDTNLWYYQFFTGFVMFFLGSVHIYVMASHPDQIGPYASADSNFTRPSVCIGWPSNG